LVSSCLRVLAVNATALTNHKDAKKARRIPETFSLPRS
jgi:hypothetical protein